MIYFVGDPPAATIKYRGVYKNKNRFQSRISVNNKRISLGSFVTEIEAALAYDRAARQWHGEFACLNFPEEQ